MARLAPVFFALIRIDAKITGTVLMILFQMEMVSSRTVPMFIKLYKTMKRMNYESQLRLYEVLLKKCDQQGIGPSY